MIYQILDVRHKTLDATLRCPLHHSTTLKPYYIISLYTMLCYPIPFSEINSSGSYDKATHNMYVCTLHLHITHTYITHACAAYTCIQRWVTASAQLHDMWQVVVEVDEEFGEAYFCVVH